MSEIHSSVVRAASTQLSKSDTNAFSEEPTYRVKLDDDIVNDVLPILMPKLLQVISSSYVGSEIKQSIYRSRGLEEHTRGLYEQTKNEVSRSNSNGSDTSTSLLLPLSPDNNVHQPNTLDSGNNGHVFYDQGQAKQVETEDGNIFSWVALQHLSSTIALIVATVVITLTGITVVWHVWFSSDIENSITLKNPFGKTSLSEDAYEYIVNSLDEYKSLIFRKDVSHIKLVISIDNPGDWPTGVVLPSLNQVKHLYVKGSLHGKKLVDLLASISSIERLTVDNEGNCICSETQQMIGTINTRFKTKASIQILTLDHFTASCTELLECMHENMKVKNLEKITYTNGELNELNVRPYENMLLEHRQSLRHIEILGTSTNVTLFMQHNFRFLTKVKRLALDIHGTPISISKTLTNICTMLPNIESLSLGNMLHKWEDIPKTFGCHRLKCFQFSLSLPASTGDFNLDFLPDAFPYLQSVDIVIVYGDSLEGTSCNETKVILGPQQLSDSLLVNTRITSNCELIFL